MADYSDRIDLGFGSLVGFGQPVGAGLAGQWLGQFVVHWAAKNILLFLVQIWAFLGWARIEIWVEARWWWGSGTCIM